MSIYQTPVTDRSQADITYETSKGFFNVGDWNRIYNNALICHNLLEFLLGDAISFTVIPVKATTDFPTIAELNALLENIENLRLAVNLSATAAMEIFHEWLDGPSAPAPDLEDANLWERVIDLVYYGTIQLMGAGTIHCGARDTAGTTRMIHCGQDKYFQTRWREWAWVQNKQEPSWPNTWRYGRSGIAGCGTSLTRNNLFRRYS